MNQQGRGGGQELETALDTIGHKVHDLRRQLRRAVVDHVSDTFLDTSGPLAILITAALAGREAEVDEASLVFSQHAAKLVEVASLACSMSSNEEGIYSSGHLLAFLFRCQISQTLVSKLFLFTSERRIFDRK